MNFTDKQKEIVARKLGYDGPMQGFDEFLNSSPSLGMKYSMLSDKFATRMAKGGVVRKKFQAGGAVTREQVLAAYAANPKAEAAPSEEAINYWQNTGLGSFNSTVDAVRAADPTLAARIDAERAPSAPTPSAPTPSAPTPAAAPTATREQVLAAYAANPLAEKTPNEEAINYWQSAGLGSFNTTVDAVRAADPALAARIDADRGTTKTTTGTTGTTGATTGTTGGVTTGSSTSGQVTGAPNIPGATTFTAAQTAVTPGMTPTATQAGATQQAAVTQAVAPTPVALPKPITAPTVTAATAAPAITDVLTGLNAQQGVVSAPALATAATQAPETTAVAGTQAAQGVAGTVQGAPTRTVQAGEMVSGPAVDMARAEQVLAQTQAAQGTVTEDMTVQGQLNKLLRDFDAGAPPPWAAASMRAANAQLAARGLGASSMAGQAIIQATLEAATPIAAADAKVFETMGLQNLSNRQQTAMLVGQQRAAFLGQEFDQAFQTRVLNAARVADIANKNFDAGTQIAIENSRLANSMDIANLSARNAVVLGKMAQMSQLETTNLNNRQQVAVENARAFLTMDIKNLDNRQQTALFRAQEMNDALISDAGFTNSVNITNANNTLDAAKVSAQLALSAETFNSDLLTKVNLSNALAANEIGKFNAQQSNAREEFNSNMVNQINIANAKVLAEVSTANTAAVNAANAVNAKNATDLSAAAYAQQSQTYRDLLEMSWKTGESEKDRTMELAKSTLAANATLNAAKLTATTAAASAVGGATMKLLENDKVWDLAASVWNTVTGD